MPSAGMTSEHHDVVVVGAGVSGLADRLAPARPGRARARGVRPPRRPDPLASAASDTWLNFGAHVYGGDGTATDRLLRGLGVTALPLPGQARRAGLRRPRRHQPGRDLPVPAAAAGALSRGADPRRPQPALRRRPLRPRRPAATGRVPRRAPGARRELHGRRVVQRAHRSAAARRRRHVPLHARRARAASRRSSPRATASATSTWCGTARPGSRAASSAGRRR